MEKKEKIRFELLAGAAIPTAAVLIITSARFGFFDGLTATALFLASLFAHEAGHAFTAMATGTRLSAVGFCLRGAYIRRSKARCGLELLISAAGPAVNLVLAVLLWGSVGIGGWLAQMNAFLVLINLVPFGGSDGQRIVAEIREWCRLTPVSSLLRP